MSVQMFWMSEKVNIVINSFTQPDIFRFNINIFCFNNKIKIFQRQI